MVFIIVMKLKCILGFDKKKKIMAIAKNKNPLEIPMVVG